MRKHLIILLAGLAVGCGADDGSDASTFGGSAVIESGPADGLGISADEAAAILLLVNTADFDTLDDDVSLDVRAARAILEARSHGDIASLDELDAVPWVGSRAFGKLVEYVRLHDLANTVDDCLIISEYIEGSADKNKAVELFNCGTRPIDLGDIAICLIRNDETDCTTSTRLGDRSLAAGETLVTCRQKVGQWKNPEVWIANVCEVEIGSTAIFSGDDRLALVRDRNGDEEWSVNRDEVLDVLGRITYRPSWSPWNDVRLQRCRLEPNPGTAFYATEDWFTTQSWSRGAGGDLGVAPTEGCD